MVLRLTVLCIVVCCATEVFAQQDTTVLAPVEIYGLRLSSYAVGTKVSALPSDHTVETLGDRLNQEASLYFKNYGNQQLSSISFRGTTASHTAVLWNGININSPTLGQTDFSLVPMFLFEEVNVYPGASSALVGNDALGGSVSLQSSTPIFVRSVSAMLHQEVGSFGRWAGGVKLNASNERWFFATRVYGSKIRNDFTYTSPAVGYSRVQENAAVQNEGLRQQIAFKINETQQLTAEVMYAHNFRHNQPAVTSFGANETTEDKQLRLAVHYDNTSFLGVLRGTLAHVRDKQHYTNDESSAVLTSQWTALINVDKQVNNRIAIRWGSSASRFEARGENYPDELKDNRFDIFASVRYQVLQNWLLGINLRQTRYGMRHAPFTPSLGTEVKLIDKNKHKVTLRSQAGRAFRIPTLNDRYWQPGGNQNLKTEDALNLEAGLHWVYAKKKHRIEADVASYQTKANEMIVWQSDEGVWRPENLQRVQIQGLEIVLKSSQALGEFTTSLSSAYSFTKSINKKSVVNEYVNKQLPYVPIHSARLLLSVSRWNWKVEVSNNVTSSRFTSLDNNDRLMPYLLSDIMVGKSLVFSRMKLTATFEANNFLSRYYENLNNHAMPGRNYSLRISLTINNQPK